MEALLVILGIALLTSTFAQLKRVNNPPEHRPTVHALDAVTDAVLFVVVVYAFFNWI